MSSLARAALWYAGKLGWLIFPCAERAKLPALERGVHRATDDLGHIEAWWRVRPNLNVAVQCGPDSGIYVLDIDQGEGKDGEAALAKLERELGPLPETVEQVTGGGGRQLFFAYPDGVELKNSVGSKGGLGAGLDTRSKGGYVVLPPSIHPSGREYAWRDGHGPNRCGFAELPELWIGRLEHRPPPRMSMPIRVPADQADRASRIIDWHVARVAGARQGERNVTLYKSSFRLAALAKAGLVSWLEAEAAMYQAGIGLGLRERGVTATIRSAHNGAANL